MPSARLVPIGPAFAGNDINVVSFRQSGLTSVIVGDTTYQFAAYYRDVPGPRPNRRVTIARRQLNSDKWQIFDQPFGDDNSNGNDSHNTISIGIDPRHFMHVSYGMHNNRLVYRLSSKPVTNDEPITFGELRPMVGEGGRANDEESVTYPQLYNLPLKAANAPAASQMVGDLICFYRNGGSGNGNSFLNRYSVAVGAWSAVAHPLFDGIRSSVNAYPNNLQFDSQGTLHMTWTDRSTPAFQTNHNLYYASSPDGGRTWTKMDGTRYELPITEDTAEVAVAIPEQSTLMNQCSMAVDTAGRPLMATWWAPKTPEGDFTRQYMLVYYDGAKWELTPITNRPHEPKQTDATVRDLGRPLVLVDKNDRIYVVLNYKERNHVVTLATSANKTDWQFTDLTTESVGIWEPTCDRELWRRENKLHLLYQPVGGGETTSTISVLEWIEASH